MTTVEKDPARGLNAALAATLKGELAASGMTFDQLAAATGISKRTLLRKLSTTERVLDIAEIAVIAAAFDLSVPEVLLAAEARLERTRKGGERSQEA